MADVRQEKMKSNITALMLFVIAVVASAQTNRLSMEERMGRVIVPSMEFRNASGADVISYLTDMAIASDPEGPFAPSCIVPLNDSNQVYYTKRTIYTYEDGARLVLKPITAEYRRISLLEALRIITSELGLTFSFDNNELLLFKDGVKIIKKEIVEQGDGECLLRRK